MKYCVSVKRDCEKTRSKEEEESRQGNTPARKRERSKIIYMNRINIIY